MSVAGKTAIVTGAATGIGAATARLLAVRGARVLAVGLQPDALRENLAGIAPAPEVVEGDLADARAVDAAVREASVVFHLGAVASVQCWMSSYSPKFRRTMSGPRPEP